MSQKTQAAIIDLAQKSHEETLRLQHFWQKDDALILEQLLRIKEFPRRAADVFLIEALGRLDVLPLQDRLLRHSVRSLYQLEQLPSWAELVERAEGWRPFRSIATWYLWQTAGIKEKLREVPAH
jgi:3-methyladenine DNA glycosylase/8-oxoguanine DNA glycosylase